MKIAKLDLWVREKEDVTSLTRREIERIQLEKLNQLLRRERARCGFYKNLPDKLESLNQLSQLPFTTEEDLKEHGNRMLLLSQSQVDRVRASFILRKIMSEPYLFLLPVCLNWYIRARKP